MGIGCGSEGAKTVLQSAYPIAFRCRQEIHEVAGCFPVFLVLERHVGVVGGPEHVKERPQCKALAPVLLEAHKHRLCAPRVDIRGKTTAVQKRTLIWIELLLVMTLLANLRLLALSQLGSSIHPDEVLTHQGLATLMLRAIVQKRSNYVQV